MTSASTGCKTRDTAGEIELITSYIINYLTAAVTGTSKGTRC